MKKCIICRQFVTGRNFFVRYHLRYEPEDYIIACNYCNEVEYSVRHFGFSWRFFRWIQKYFFRKYYYFNLINK